jgi:NAD(P)-dependent dehydrogenase (short-subunit alcohol dehydrogenase family)
VGKLDLLVNNAGYDYAKMIEDYKLSEMRYLVDLLLVSRFLTTKLALPLLKKSPNPNIINIASRMGMNTTIATIGPYGAAEAGVIKFTQCCAVEFAQYSIRVNCVAPGLTKTDLTTEILTQAEFAEAALANPSHRVGTPEDVARVVKFVASRGANYINGATIPVTGGSS